MEIENIGEQLLDACLNDVEHAAWIISHHNNKHYLNWQEKKCHNSILHILVYQNLHNSVELLLNSGADPNIVNKNGETPLHWAVRMNSFECARLLIHHSANVNKKDKSGSTPLHLCCAYGIPELLPLLLTSGSHLNILDKEQKTPLDLAADGEHSDAHVACAVLLRRHIELFQSDDISKFTTKPLLSSASDPVPFEDTAPEPQTSPSLSKQKLLPPFIAGSSMRVAQWEWKRALSEYKLTPSAPFQSSPVRSSHSPLQNSFPVVDERPRSNPLMESISKLSDTKGHSSLSQSLGLSPTISATKIPPIQAHSPAQQTQTMKQRKKIPLVLPFKPVSALIGDVFLSVEMCGDCHLHNWSLWHNEDRYNGAANECLRVIIHDLMRNSPKIRLFAYKSKVNTQKNRERIGALEVVVSVKSSKNWAMHSIFSKLKSQSWPKTSTFGNSASNFVNSLSGLVTSRNSSRKSADPSEPEEPQSRRKLELMFAQWHDRLYGNFRIEEGDETLTSSDPLSGSFFNPNFDGDHLGWEALNMNHFLVYDGTDSK